MYYYYGHILQALFSFSWCLERRSSQCCFAWSDDLTMLCRSMARVLLCTYSAPAPVQQEAAGRQRVGGRAVAGVGQCWREWSREQRTGSVRDMESSCWRSRCEVCPALSGSASTHPRTPARNTFPDTLPFLALKSHIVHLASCFAGVFTLAKRYSRRARLGILVELLTVESSFSPRALTLTPYSSTASLFKALASVWQLATFCSYCLCVCVREGKCFVDENRVRF